MTAEQLKTTRKSWQMSQSELAMMLQTPLRTYQDWESGRGRIPGIIAVTLGLLQERDERVTAKVLANAAERIAAEFPNGIPSQPEPEEE